MFQALVIMELEAGGYFGGTGSYHREGGGGGGSAYADIEGTILKVSNIKGYSDHITASRTDGTPVQAAMLQSDIEANCRTTYYGRYKDGLTYGNGYVAIEKQ